MATQPPPPPLRLFSESSLPGGSRAARIATSSPTLDLVATTTDDGVVSVLRSKSQPVFKHAQKGLKAEVLRWRADGRFLAVGWSDGSVRLVDMDGSRAADRLDASAGGSSRPVYIAWAPSITGRRHLGGSAGAAAAPGRAPTEEEPRLEKKEDLVDLPHELTFLEVDTALPKLSPLPVSGGVGDDMFVFSTRAGLESAFRPLQPEDKDVVDVLVVGTSDGWLHISVYESFALGSFQYSPVRGGAPALLRCHSSTPRLSTHSLLFQPQQQGGGGGGAAAAAVYLVNVDLRWIAYSPVNLSLLASKTTTLHKLLRYIKQTQTHMVNEYKSTRELPSRFLAGIQDDLQKMKGGPMTIVQALYHTVVTGHCFDPVKEWLVDTLAERGHKRWDKAVTTGLESLRTLVHEHMLPALERAGLVLSRLRGLARFHEAGEPIGFTSAGVARLVDAVAALTLVCHRVLLCAMEELELFWAFSAWLRLQIDALAASTAPEELSEKEALTDNAKVLAYIRDYLLASPLGLYLGPADPADRSADAARLEGGAGPSLLALLDEQLRRREEGGPHMRALPKAEFLVDHLSGRAAALFRGIGEAQKRTVRFGEAPVRIELGGGAVAGCDMRTVPVPKENGVDALTFTALTSETQENKLYIFKTDIEVINGISSVRSTESCGLALAGGRIQDFKFLDDDLLLVLWYPEEEPPVVLRLPYRSAALPYAPYEAGAPPAVASLGADEAAGLFSPAGLPGGLDFRPVRMEVREATGVRGEIPARVCLLGDDHVGYKVFALPDEDGPAATRQTL